MDKFVGATNPEQETKKKKKKPTRYTGYDIGEERLISSKKSEE